MIIRWDMMPNIKLVHILDPVKKIHFVHLLIIEECLIELNMPVDFKGPPIHVGFEHIRQTKTAQIITRLEFVDMAKAILLHGQANIVLQKFVAIIKLCM